MRQRAAGAHMPQARAPRRVASSSMRSSCSGVGAGLSCMNPNVGFSSRDAGFRPTSACRVGLQRRLVERCRAAGQHARRQLLCAQSASETFVQLPGRRPHRCGVSTSRLWLLQATILPRADVEGRKAANLPLLHDKRGGRGGGLSTAGRSGAAHANLHTQCMHCMYGPAR